MIRLAVGRTLLLALLIALPGSPAHERGARAPGGAIRLVVTARGLEVDGRGLRVRITRQPWQIAILNDAGRTLVQSDLAAAGPLTFVLDTRALARLLPSGRPAAGQIAVHLRRLLPGWIRLRDGVVLHA